MELQLPTRRDALNLLVKAGCSPNVVKHCESVSALAVKICRACKKKGLKVDTSLVEISALLHDIGRSKTHTVDHSLIGGEIARSLDLPESVIFVIERHVGGGISETEAKKLGWPRRNYLPKTIEEKIVCYADKRIEGHKIISIEQTIQTYATVLGRKHSAIKRIWQLHLELTSLAGDLNADSELT